MVMLILESDETAPMVLNQWVRLKSELNCVHNTVCVSFDSIVKDKSMCIVYGISRNECSSYKYLLVVIKERLCTLHKIIYGCVVYQKGIKFQTWLIFK